MEDKKLDEKESLELISNMIKQTNNHMALGAGNTFIAWGVILFVVSLAANIAVANTQNPLWMWLYFAIPVLGLPIEWWLKRKARQNYHVKTYIEDSIEKVWKCLGALLLIYPVIILLLHSSTGSRAWIAMFFLGMFLPSLGSYITGVLLKMKHIEGVSWFACGMSLIFLEKIVEPGFTFSLSTTYIFPLCAVCSLIIPGLLINRRAAEENE